MKLNVRVTYRCESSAYSQIETRNRDRSLESAGFCTRWSNCFQHRISLWTHSISLMINTWHVLNIHDWIAHDSYLWAEPPPSPAMVPDLARSWRETEGCPGGRIQIHSELCSHVDLKLQNETTLRLFNEKNLKRSLRLIKLIRSPYLAFMFSRLWWSLCPNTAPNRFIRDSLDIAHSVGPSMLQYDMFKRLASNLLSSTRYPIHSRTFSLLHDWGFTWSQEPAGERVQTLQPRSQVMTDDLWQ